MLSRTIVSWLLWLSKPIPTLLKQWICSLSPGSQEAVVAVQEITPQPLANHFLGSRLSVWLLRGGTYFCLKFISIPFSFSSPEWWQEFLVLQLLHEGNLTFCFCYSCETGLPTIFFFFFFYTWECLVYIDKFDLRPRLAIISILYLSLFAFMSLVRVNTVSIAVLMMPLRAIILWLFAASFCIESDTTAD